ncbi:uncharacterized protein LOC131991487 [Centropristis striata]|uniref:uncharacterized protein LOC131991487 n=1 Tax=Centropristis striata TaxID=184440 RepID=UPI0027E05940|nr:uncharacterized protein LOC131991487 [Centropristis striata]
MTEEINTVADEVKFRCSVKSFVQCAHTVGWLFQGEAVNKDNRELDTYRDTCYTTGVAFPTSHFSYTSRYNSFKCDVTNDYTGKVHQFVFSPQSSGEDTLTTESTTTIEATPTPKINKTAGDNDASAELSACAGWSSLDYVVLVMRVAELLLVTVITVLLIKDRGSQRAAGDNKVDNNNKGGDGGVVNYENVGEPSVSVRM